MRFVEEPSLVIQSVLVNTKYVDLHLLNVLNLRYFITYLGSEYINQYKVLSEELIRQIIINVSFTSLG